MFTSFPTSIPPSPSLISFVVSVDVKHHVYLLAPYRQVKTGSWLCLGRGPASCTCSSLPFTDCVTPTPRAVLSTPTCQCHCVDCACTAEVRIKEEIGSAAGMTPTFKSSERPLLITPQPDIVTPAASDQSPHARVQRCHLEFHTAPKLKSLHVSAGQMNIQSVRAALLPLKQWRSPLLAAV